MESGAISWKEVDTLTKLLSDKIKATGKNSIAFQLLLEEVLSPQDW